VSPRIEEQPPEPTVDVGVAIEGRSNVETSRLATGATWRRLGHVPALDGLRGIAILLVLSFHSGHARGGWLGVDLFFVLSGFLITSLLVSEWASTGAISLPAFYRRRALRLLPALLTMLAAYGAFALATESRAQMRDTAVSVLLGLTYTTNIHNYFVAGGAPDWALQHLWTLATEEQFYLLWPPILAFFLLRRPTEPRTVLAWLGAAALLLAMTAPWVAPWPVAIVVGCIVGLALTQGWLSRTPHVVRIAGLVLAVPLALLATQTRVPLYDGPPIILFAVGSALVILACVCHPEWWFARLVGHEPLRYVGRISYGLYLWHLPIAKIFMSWTLALPVTFVVAALSYRFVEQPFLRRRPRVRQTADASTVVPASVPAA
jgi:peptidoglycan/LPS O-acetylase OafA/YrhL